jgi:hypothetical protein
MKRGLATGRRNPSRSNGSTCRGSLQEVWKHKQKEVLGKMEEDTRDPWVLKQIEQGLKVNILLSDKQRREPKEMPWEADLREQWEWRQKAIDWGAIKKVAEERIGEIRV